ncbi:MAG: ATP-binding protein [Rhodopila sp.]
MNDLLEQFLLEARDLIEEAASGLLEIERDGTPERMNAVFRALHTLKGSSGLFDFPPLTTLLHAAEDRLSALCRAGAGVSPDLVDLLLQTLDQTSEWLAQIEAEGRLPANAPVAEARLVAALRSGLADGQAMGSAKRAAMDVPPALVAADAVLAGLPNAQRQAITDRIKAGEALTAITYTPASSCFFNGDDPLGLMLQVPEVVGCSIAVPPEWGGGEAFDPFRCELAFHALSFAPRRELEALLRYVLDQAQLTEVDPAAFAEAAPSDPGSTPSLSGAAAATCAILDEQATMLETPCPPEALAGRIESAAPAAGHVLAALGEPAEAIAQAAAASRAAASGGMLAGAIRVAREALADKALADKATPLSPSWPGVGRPSAPHRRSADARDKPGHDEGAAPLSGEREAPLPSAVRPGGDAGPPKAESTDRGSHVLRVDQGKLDLLMAQIGELVVAKNSLPFLARKAETTYGVRDLARDIKDQYAVIDRIVQELQGAIMSVRMLPIGQVFQRFPRLVRDLSRKLGKKVELVIEGEDTEADKNVIESLYDPLLHMVRNSLDHGIEAPEERIAAGKPPQATLRLSARQDNDQVVLEIADDGRGIDPAKVRRRAYERGLLDEAALEQMSDRDAVMLIFRPGFSMADRVSDVSGRGVGMDVVRTAVDRAGGRIDVSSTVGQGTTIRIRLPLSMAVSRVMSVHVGQHLFGVPMDLIVETVKLGRHALSRIGNHDACVLRGKVVPLVELADLLELGAEACAQETEIPVLVTSFNGQTIGLVVSGFGENMEVILKPLDGVLAGARGYAGTALLGDGRILLVLDPRELMP